jgi:hypothetical protein
MATIEAATTVADPRSPRQLHRRDAGGGDGQRGQQIRPGGDRRDDELAVDPQMNSGAAGRDFARHGDGRALVATRGQSCGLAGGVDAANLHGHSRDTGQAEHQHRDQRGDAERRFDGAGARIIG